MAGRLHVWDGDRRCHGIYSSPDGVDAVYSRAELVAKAVRFALGKVACRPREVLVCSVCQENVAGAAREFFDQHATDSIRRVTFEPVREK